VGLMALNHLNGPLNNINSFRAAIVSCVTVWDTVVIEQKHEV